LDQPEDLPESLEETPVAGAVGIILEIE